LYTRNVEDNGSRDIT